MLIETMQTQGVDSFAALAAATIQGSTETTFYAGRVLWGGGHSARPARRGLRLCWPNWRAWWRPLWCATGFWMKLAWRLD